MKKIQIPAFFASILTLVTASHAVASEPAWQLVAELRGVQSDRGGKILCSLFGGEAGFPMDGSKAISTVVATGEGATRACTFVVPGPGTYAVSVAHDENGNRKVDTKVFGIPTEGWATSNNVKPRFRAPTFGESSFEIDSPEVTQRLQMHY